MNKRRKHSEQEMRSLYDRYTNESIRLKDLLEEANVPRGCLNTCSLYQLSPETHCLRMPRRNRVQAVDIIHLNNNATASGINVSFWLEQVMKLSEVEKAGRSAG